MANIFFLKVGQSKNETRKDAPEFRLFKPTFFLYPTLELFSKSDGAKLIKDNKFK